MTYQQCKALGIEHLWPERSEPTEIARAMSGLPTAKRQAKSADGMNKTERAFGEMLDGSKRSAAIIEWWFEPFRIRLAGKTGLKIDFLVEPDDRLDNRLVVVETKGYMRDDAAVKLKVAAEKFSCFRWLLVTRDGRHGWEVREVTRNGIGRTPIEVPWIE